MQCTVATITTFIVVRNSRGRYLSTPEGESHDMLLCVFLQLITETDLGSVQTAESLI